MFSRKSGLISKKEGFSLVELIIVIAIMVALVAIMAPQFVGYIQRARDSVLNDSAEEVLHITKTEYALGNLKLINSSDGRVIVYSDSDGQIHVDLENLEYTPDTDTLPTFEDVCALDEKRNAKSDIVWEINITEDCNGAIFSKQTVA